MITPPHSSAKRERFSVTAAPATKTASHAAFMVAKSSVTCQRFSCGDVNPEHQQQPPGT